MKQLLVLFVLFFLTAFSVKAQEAVDENSILNAFGVPEQTLRIIKAPDVVPNQDVIKNFPACNNPELVKRAQEILRQNQKDNIDTGSIYHQRKIRLALKNINNFQDVSLNSFRPKDNYLVAQKMISIKINEYLSDEDLKLCASDNPILKNKVYLLMHRVSDGIKVDILNYPLNTPEANPFFIYK